MQENINSFEAHNLHQRRFSGHLGLALKGIRAFAPEGSSDTIPAVCNSLKDSEWGLWDNLFSEVCYTH